jgi:hypothetical protein
MTSLEITRIIAVRRFDRRVGAPSETVDRVTVETIPFRSSPAHDTVGAVCRPRPCAAGPVLTSHVDPLTNVVFTRDSSVNVFVAQERLYLR